MKNTFVGGLLLAAFLAAPMTAQMPEGYLDVYIARVKMGKRVEFDSVNKRMAELNHRNKGDAWLAYELTYGTDDTVYFVSSRASYTAAEEGNNAFEGSMAKTLGKAGMLNMLTSFSSTLDGARTELRRRRSDLSANVPLNTAAYNQLIGTARYMRIVTIHVRPGRNLDFEAQLKLNKAAQERVNPGIAYLVSQSQAGAPLGIYYIATPLKSLGELDKIKGLPETLGSGYERYLKASAEMVTSTEILVGKFLPEISNPPEEIVSVDPKFWRPAPPPAPSKPAEAKKP